MTIYRIKLLDAEALAILQSLDKVGLIQVLEKEEVETEDTPDAATLEKRVLARLDALEIPPPSEEELEDLFAEMKEQRIKEADARRQVAKLGAE
ncbi:hypothetical protein QWY85_18195 [Neolewinella lacunae]|uniref:Uncharacterized protein n=1 Tax=Neolewinella lacunae TaxID=1517758 RepID=A0A923PQP8_9BACT|nr:hypothetical protein [Neolewinella lacunae]MBC6995703.1 hypothetical protein [Neolewinella lacunae]MDN3636604.1 hypothetical protein [Neolewinella lacunae]